VPELPEVETTRRSLARQIIGARVHRVVTRRDGLRWPFNADFNAVASGYYVVAIRRRAKYLLLDLAQEPTGRAQASFLAHLGMSGVLAVVPNDRPVKAHDHVDFELDMNVGCASVERLTLRFNDPRRFGALLWLKADDNHPLLQSLGPDPLELNDLTLGKHFYQAAHKRSAPIKGFIMDQTVVVGVGNIYASEALYAAGIHPKRAAGRVSLTRFEVLARHVQRILQAAIDAGGSTIRDYRSGEGESGRFQAQAQVYGRAGEPCSQCASPVRVFRQGGRATYWCAGCQR
jgi:formamidopyrimidine-DNA glycosylase